MVVKKAVWKGKKRNDGLTHREMDRDSLTNWQKIGEGNFGEVHRALQIRDGDEPLEVAVKLLKPKASAASSEDFFNEAKVLAQFDHENVLQLLGVVMTTIPYLVILELIEYGDLKTMFEPARGAGTMLTITENVAIVAQICAGMEHVAGKKVIHRDLAIRNCLLSHSNLIKVADMGLARMESEYVSDTSTALPVKWMAIESLEEQKYSEASDVWSFGITAWEVFTMGLTPYKGTPNRMLTTRLRSGAGAKSRLECPKNLTLPGAWKVLHSCWDLKPENRPSFAQLVPLITTFLQDLVVKEPIRRDVGQFLSTFTNKGTENDAVNEFLNRERT